jgi:hypothetical protein
MRPAERGSALLITMIIGIALLAGGAVLIGLQMSSTRSAGITKSKLNATYCAETGLANAHGLLATNHAGWNAALCNPPPPRGTGACVIGSPAAEPSWLRAPALPHDIDGDGTDDFILTIVDNEDDGNPLADTDDQLLLISTCVADPEAPLRLTELIRYDPVSGKISRRAWLKTD